MAKVVQALAKWRFGPYRALVDRAGDNEEDAEVGVLVEDRGEDYKDSVIELAQQLTQTPFNVSGTSVFAHYPRLARFVANRSRARVADCASVQAKLAADFQTDVYRDIEEASEVAGDDDDDVDDGIYFVDLLALLEMFTHALFVNPRETESEFARFLDYYGSACEEELCSAPAQAGLFPTEPRTSSALGTPSPYSIVIASNPCPFYDYVNRMLPPDFMTEAQCEPAHRALQVLPLHPVITLAMTGRPPGSKKKGYEVLPLWPYFAWKMTK